MTERRIPLLIESRIDRAGGRHQIESAHHPAVNLGKAFDIILTVNVAAAVLIFVHRMRRGSDHAERTAARGTEEPAALVGFNGRIDPIHRLLGRRHQRARSDQNKTQYTFLHNLFFLITDYLADPFTVPITVYCSLISDSRSTASCRKLTSQPTHPVRRFAVAEHPALLRWQRLVGIV